MLSRRVLISIGAAATVVSGVVVMEARAGSPYDWAANLPGCHVSAPAVAHHAGQAVLQPQPTDGPVPCGTLTGWPAVENKIEVTNDNTVFYEPALLGGPYVSGGGHAPGWGKEFGIAFTNDGGAAWSSTSVTVNPDTYAEDGQVDNNIYVDHDTGSFFWYMYNAGNAQVQGVCGNGGGATVAFSRDVGKTWGWGFDPDHDCAENPDLLTAKPTVPGEQLSYRNVVYLCGDNASSGAATTGTPGYSCSKSLNGGASWLGTTLDDPLGPHQGFYSGQAKDALDPYPQCGGQSSSAGPDVQPLPDGTLAVIVSCNGVSFLSESTDEGGTWKIVHPFPGASSSGTGAPGAGPTLRIDRAGNMYLVDVVNGSSHMTPSLPVPSSSSGNSQILLSHSIDGGRTWSQPLNMVAPGVTSVGTWSFAQGTYAPGMVGNVAVTYYGIDPNSPDGKNGYSDGFITQTKDALDANPVFWSGQVNQPGQPLLYNSTTDGDIGITVLDFNGGALSPDGRSAWGSWVQDCGANVATSPGCVSRYPHTNPANPDDGFAGRLVWPAGDN